MSGTRERVKESLAAIDRPVDQSGTARGVVELSRLSEVGETEDQDLVSPIFLSVIPVSIMVDTAKHSTARERSWTGARCLGL